MLKVIKKRWYSRTFTVLEESNAVADSRLSFLREKGVLTVQGQSYAMHPEGFFSRRYLLESAGSVSARAQNVQRYHHIRCLIHHAGRQYALPEEPGFDRARCPFGSDILVFLLNDTQIGSISRENSLTFRGTVDLPHDIPLPVKIFIICLALITWKYEAQEQDTGGTGGLSQRIG